MKPPVAVALIGAGVLALAYNVRIYSELLSPPKSSMNPATSAEGEESEQVSEQPDAVASLDVERMRAFLASLPPRTRDPFHFASESNSAPGVASAQLVVQGVLIGKDRRIAWINDRAHGEGEEVGGQLIVKIEPGLVRLRSGDREIEVPAARDETLDTPEAPEPPLETSP